MTLLVLWQTLPSTNLKDDWVVIGAAAIIVALQGWQIRNTSWLKIEVTKITTHLFGGGGSDGGQSEEVSKLRKNVHNLRNEVSGLKNLFQLVEDRITDFLRRLEWLERREQHPRALHQSVDPKDD